MQPDITLPKTPAVGTYTGLLIQMGTSDPTVIEIQNTIGGTPVWSRTGIGEYMVTITGKFTENKTITTITNVTINNDKIAIIRNDENSILIYTFNSSGAAADNVLGNTSFEIKVYNN